MEQSSKLRSSAVPRQNCSWHAQEGLPPGVERRGKLKYLLPHHRKLLTAVAPRSAYRARSWGRLVMVEPRRELGPVVVAGNRAEGLVGARRVAVEKLGP